MGIVRFALRLTALKAITGKTFAGSRVQDSSIVPLADAINKEPKPVIVIYTDDDDVTMEGLDLFTPQSSGRAMVFLLAVAGAVTAEGTGIITFQFPPTDAATELTLDLMERDVMRALLDPRDPWADLWRRFAMRTTRYRSQRGASEEKGTRFAARQVVMDLDPISEPVPGGIADGIWSDLLAAIAADPDEDFAGIAPVLRKSVEGYPMADREREQMAVGLTKAGAYVTGKEPGVKDYTEEPGEELPELSEVSIDAGSRQMVIDPEPPPEDDGP